MLVITFKRRLTESYLNLKGNKMMAWSDIYLKWMSKLDQLNPIDSLEECSKFEILIEMMNEGYLPKDVNKVLLAKEIRFKLFEEL